ncbi:MAG: O-antigen ligase family protein [Patescibacteria group bacterium]
MFKNFVLIFLLALWFINPSNKLILLFFLIFLVVGNQIIKKLDISLVLTFFLSSFFAIGKTYLFQLFDSKQFSNLINLSPIKITTLVQITVSDVLFALLVTYTIIACYKKIIKFNKISFIDLSLIIFFLYGIISDIIVSNNLYLSLFLKKGLFEYIFIYFFIKFAVKDHRLLYRSFLNLITSLVFFEIFVGLQQFIYSSPIGKALESTLRSASFGEVPDELSFVFRPFGTFYHANMFAIFLAVILPFFLFFMIKSQKYIFKLGFFLMVVCLILTLGRAAWLASLISSLSILFYFEYHKKIILIRSLSFKKIVLCLFLVLPLFIYSIPRVAKISNILEEGGGLNVRIKQTNEALELVSQSPLFGVGKEMSIVKAIERNPEGVFASFPSEIHNYFLLLAVENGLPYLGFFVTFLFFSFKKLIDYKTDLSFISLISLSSMMIIGLFQPFLISNLFFILLAFDYDKISKDSYGY